LGEILAKSNHKNITLTDVEEFTPKNIKIYEMRSLFDLFSIKGIIIFLIVFVLVVCLVCTEDMNESEQVILVLTLKSSQISLKKKK
jgi:hypothetical protein